jgi:ferrous iron transport protein A
MPGFGRPKQTITPAGQSPTQLAELGVGENGAVRRIRGSDESTFRLMEMGLTPGTRVQVNGVAPLGDPLHITLRGYNLSIRRREAEGIEVDRLA